MYIIQSDSEDKLVAAMLWLEHGAKTVGDDLRPLPKPHAPFPTVTLPPVTEAGVPLVVHYRPTVGVVYYCGGAIQPLVRRLADRLGAWGDDHLVSRPRAAAVTGSTVLRHKNRLVSATAVVGPRACYRSDIAEKDGLPARMLLFTPPTDRETPPHYSIRAGFTWVFAPVQTAISICRKKHFQQDTANAIVASIFYDASGVCRSLKEGAEVTALNLSHFAPRLPPKWAAALGRGAILVDGGRARYAETTQYLHNGPQRGTAALPREAWSPETYLVGAPALRFGAKDTRVFRCTLCETPLGGHPVVVLRDLEYPGAMMDRLHMFWKLPDDMKGAVLRAPYHTGGVLVCDLCWESIDPACYPHLRAKITCTTPPYGQADACEALGGAVAGLATLLRCALTAVRPGVYVARAPDPADSLLLVGENHIEDENIILDPAVAGGDLPVHVARLVEVVPG